MKCPKCGNEFEGNFCNQCGTSIGGAPSQPTPPPPQPQIVINNVNSNTVAGYGVRVKNKWVALVLCLFLGFLGAHKFYEGKILLGVVYIFTLGLCGIGVLIDFIMLLFKPNPYTV